MSHMYKNEKVLEIENFGIFYDDDEGFNITSPNGVVYDILEGMAVNSWKSSDIGFIFDNKECKVVGFFFGVGFLKIDEIINHDGFVIGLLNFCINAIKQYEEEM